MKAQQFKTKAMMDDDLKAHKRKSLIIDLGIIAIVALSIAVIVTLI